MGEFSTRFGARRRRCRRGREAKGLRRAPHRAPSTLHVRTLALGARRSRVLGVRLAWLHASRRCRWPWRFGRLVHVRARRNVESETAASRSRRRDSKAPSASRRSMTNSLLEYMVSRFGLVGAAQRFGLRPEALRRKLSDAREAAERRKSEKRVSDAARERREQRGRAASWPEHERDKS